MGISGFIKKVAKAVKKGINHAAKEAKDEYKKKIEKPFVKPATKPIVDGAKAVANGIVHVSGEIADGIDHAFNELTDEVGDFFNSESEKDKGVIKRGRIGDGFWCLLSSNGNIRLDSTICLGVSTKIYVTCKTADGKNNGHLYQNKLGLDFSLEQGGHVEEKDFERSTVYEGNTMLVGTREFRFSVCNESAWTFITVHVFNEVKPVISVSFEGDIGIILKAYGLTVNIPITDFNPKIPSNSEWKMSFKESAENFGKYKYNKDGYVDKNGEIQNTGLGCSAFVSVVLHQMKFGENWLKSYDWKAYQLTGQGLAELFDLPLMATVSAGVLTSGEARQALIKSGRLKENAMYLFNIWKGSDHGHVGFIVPKANGNFDQFHYSGLSEYEGLAHGNFIKWYESSMYKGQSIELYGVPLPGK